MTKSESTIPFALVLLILIAMSGPAAAQQAPEPLARASAGIAGPRPVAVAKRAEEAVLLDGTLDDRAWQNAVPMTGFLQADPLEGEPPSELTEVRMLYDWEVKTSVTASAWIAEFRIPLHTLRYGPPPQVWGVNFARNIQRHRERSFWSPLPRQYDLSRLSSAGEMHGLQLRTPRNFKVLPYVVGSADRTYAPRSTPVDGNGD